MDSWYNKLFSIHILPPFVVLLPLLYWWYRILPFFLNQVREIHSVNKWSWSYAMLQRSILLMVIKVAFIFLYVGDILYNKA